MGSRAASGTGRTSVLKEISYTFIFASAHIHASQILTYPSAPVTPDILNFFSGYQLGKLNILESKVF